MPTSHWASTSQLIISSSPAKAPVVLFVGIGCKVELRLELVWKHRSTSHQALLQFKWPGNNFRDKCSSTAVYGVFTSSCWYHLNALFTSENESIYYTTYYTICTKWYYMRAVFCAGLRSRYFLFLTWGQWQHVTFTNFFPLLSHRILSWKNPPRAKEGLTVKKQACGHWNQSFRNKWEWQHCTQPVKAMPQRDRGDALLPGTPAWLKESITLGHGWLFWWDTFCGVDPDLEQRRAIATISSPNNRLINCYFQSAEC